jgi:CubicO group peptidase (beta-lactamase class C family)
VVAAWGEIDRRFQTHSVRKSLISALIGIYVDEGKVDLSRTVGELGIDDKDGLTETEMKAKVFDLIRARSGVYHPAAKEPADMKAERPARGSHEPGTHFWYNNWDFNTVGIILEKQTGKGIDQLLKERIAGPIGMEDFRPSDFYYQMEPSFSIHPAYSFRMSARDLARFGQLFEQDGAWGGKQLVPAAWVKESTSLHSDTGEGYGYGYMWWVFPKGTPSKWPELSKYHKFAASGTGSQFLMVIPEIDLVFVVRGDTDNIEGGPNVSEFKLAEMIAAARAGEATSEPQLEPVKPTPFERRMPSPRDRTAIAIDPGELDDYLGIFEAPPQMHVTIYKWNDRLFGLARGQGETEIFPEADDLFFAKDVNLQVRFERDAEGVVNGAEITLYNRPMKVQKTGSLPSQRN